MNEGKSMAEEKSIIESIQEKVHEIFTDINIKDRELNEVLFMIKGNYDKIGIPVPEDLLKTLDERSPIENTDRENNIKSTEFIGSKLELLELLIGSVNNELNNLRNGLKLMKELTDLLSKF